MGEEVYICAVHKAAFDFDNATRHMIGTVACEDNKSSEVAASHSVCDCGGENNDDGFVASSSRPEHREPRPSLRRRDVPPSVLGWAFRLYDYVTVQKQPHLSLQQRKSLNAVTLSRCSDLCPWILQPDPEAKNKKKNDQQDHLPSSFTSSSPMTSRTSPVASPSPSWQDELEASVMPSNHDRMDMDWLAFADACRSYSWREWNWLFAHLTPKFPNNQRNLSHNRNHKHNRKHKNMWIRTKYASYGNV